MGKQIKGILGTKLGMTQVFNDAGQIVPVTVVQAGPCVVTAVRTPDNDGYSAVQFGFGDGRRSSLIGSQVPAVHHVSGVRAPDLFLQIHLVARAEVKLVIQDQQLGFRFRSDFCELRCRRMKARVIRAAFGSEHDLEAVVGVDLMYQHVACATCLRYLLTGRGVARALAMPRNVRRVPVRLLVDVRRRDDAQEREGDDSGGKPPPAIGLGWDVPIDVLSHGGNIEWNGGRVEGSKRACDWP